MIISLLKLLNRYLVLGVCSFVYVLNSERSVPLSAIDKLRVVFQDIIYMKIKYKLCSSKWEMKSNDQG